MLKNLNANERQVVAEIPFVISDYERKLYLKDELLQSIGQFTQAVASLY